MVTNLVIKTKTLGRVTIKLARYFNPQIRTGVEFDIERTNMIDLCQGACVREALPKALRIRSILDLKPKVIKSLSKKRVRTKTETFIHENGTKTVMEF